MKNFLSIKTIAHRLLAGLGAMAICIAPFPAIAQNTENILLERARNTLETFPADLETARQEGKESELYALYNGGDAYLYIGEFTEAQKHFTRALQLSRELGNRHLEHGTLQQLATVHVKLGDVQGLDFLTAELANATDIESRKIVLRVLGMSYFGYLGDATFADSVDVWQEYLQLAKQTNNLEEQAEALFFLGQIHAREPYFSRAIDYLQQAIALRETLSDSSFLPSYFAHLATVQRLNKDFPAALASIDRMAEAFNTIAEESNAGEKTQKQWELGVLRDRAIVHTAAEDYGRAISTYQQRLAIAQEIPSPIDEASSFDALTGNFFWQGNLAKALETQQQALDRYLDYRRDSDIPLFSAIPTAREKLAFLLLRADRLPEAEQSLQLALDEYDIWYEQYLMDANSSQLSTDLINVFGQAAFTDTYSLLQQIYIARDRVEDALEASESGRARAFSQLIATRLQDAPHLLPNVEPPNIKEIKAIAKAEQTTIVEYSVIFEYNKYFLAPIGRDSSENPATKLYIWVVQPTGEVHWREVEIEDGLVKLVRQARGAIASGQQLSRRLQIALQKLHRVLIDPIAEFLPTDASDRVTFIPHNILFYTPFPALMDTEGRALIEKHTILTAPSIQILSLSRQTQNRLNPTQKPFIVGNPEMPVLPRTPHLPPQSLSSLPGAEEEAQKIAKLFNVEPFIGPTATEANAIARMEGASLIHIATHGILDYSGLLGSLAFTPTTNEDGFLTAREIANLDIEAELVVLSACDTGRGELSDGDGVIGLSRAFLGAGAANLVMSLWPVPDAATAVLMEEFYRSWQGGASKAEALREAMLATREQFPHPKNWAAFAIVGTGD